ncbi:PAS domain S-box protein [Candidatus Thorarchaeota archaeon]|nr:MAG: PAS domain S-box protein [Candidatus Thorarchaeota archaeon]
MNQLTDYGASNKIPGLDGNSIKLLMDKSSNGILVVKDNTIVYANQALADLFEAEKQELLGKRFTDISNSLLGNAAPAALERYFLLLDSDSTHDDEEYEFVDSSGRVRKISVSADVTKFGEQSMVSIIIRDLTEQSAIEVVEKRVHEAEKRAQESMNSIQSNLDRAEDLLRESESRFRSLFEDSPISLWEEDFSRVKAYFDTLRGSGISDFRKYFDEHPDELRKCIHLVELLNVNQATLDLHDVESQEELIKGVDSIISEGTTDAFKEELVALANGATHFRGESEFQLASGKFRDLLLTVTIPPGHEDTWDRVYVAMLDITERNRAKMMLHREREAYRLVADAAVHSEDRADLCGRVLSGLIETLDFDLGVIRLLVPEESKLQLIALEGVDQGQVKQEIDMESSDGANMLVARTARTKKPILAGDVHISDETQNQMERIQELGIESLISWPLLNANNDVLGVLNIASRGRREFVDLDRSFFDTIADLLATVLERQITEEQLRNAEEHFRIVSDTVRDGLIIRRNDRVVLINDRACEIFGYPREELMEMTVIELACPEERERLKRAYGKMRLSESELTELEFWVQRKDGSRAFIKNRYTVMMNDDGSASHFIIITDETERKLAEEEVKAARARAEFFNDLMAHDLNNVHQGIMTSLELLLLNPDLPSHLKNKLQAALEQVKRSLELIANVRKFSVVDEAARNLTETQLTGVIKTAKDAIINAFPTKDVTFITEIDENYCARADEFLIDVFYNLFHNAVKFSDSEDITIEVKADRIVHQDLIEISVTDYGPGISDEHKESLFARLLPDRRSGSGIGLTLVKRIIERYGGRVRVEDRIEGDPTSGTKFVLQIPECKS